MTWSELSPLAKAHLAWYPEERPTHHGPVYFVAVILAMRETDYLSVSALAGCDRMHTLRMEKLEGDV
jgi:hypothetical protein